MRSYIKGSPCQGGQEISALMLLFPASMKLFAFSLFMSIAFQLGTRSGLHAHQAKRVTSQLLQLYYPYPYARFMTPCTCYKNTYPLFFAGGLYCYSKIRLRWRSEPFGGSGEWKCIPAVESIWPWHGLMTAESACVLGGRWQLFHICNFPVIWTLAFEAGQGSPLLIMLSYQEPINTGLAPTSFPWQKIFALSFMPGKIECPRS